MSDDLVKRLRSKIYFHTDAAVWMHEAADRIEELEAKLRKSALQELSLLGQEIEVTAELEQAEAKIVELEAKLAWQPIETAPRDGTQFLGWSKLHGVQSCLIQKEQAHYKRVEAVYGGPQKRTWFCPTHWRPLPNGPKETEYYSEEKTQHVGT